MKNFRNLREMKENYDYRFSNDYGENWWIKQKDENTYLIMGSHVDFEIKEVDLDSKWLSYIMNEKEKQWLLSCIKKMEKKTYKPIIKLGHKNPENPFEHIEELVEKDGFLNYLKQVPSIQVDQHLLEKIKAFYDNYLISFRYQKLSSLNPENEPILERYKIIQKNTSKDVDVMIRTIKRTVTPHREALLTAFEEAKKIISEKVVE